MAKKGKISKPKFEVSFDEMGIDSKDIPDIKAIAEDKRNKAIIKRENEKSAKFIKVSAEQLTHRGISVKNVVQYMQKCYDMTKDIEFDYEFMPCISKPDSDNYYIKQIASNLYEFGRYKIARFGQASTLEKACRGVRKRQKKDKYFTDIIFFEKNQPNTVIVF